MGAESVVLSLRLTMRLSITFILFLLCLLFPLLVQLVDLSLEHPPVLFDVGLKIAFHCNFLGGLMSLFLNDVDLSCIRLLPYRLMISTSIRDLWSSLTHGRQ